MPKAGFEPGIFRSQGGGRNHLANEKMEKKELERSEKRQTEENEEEKKG